VAHDFAAEYKSVAGHESLDEIFLDLAKHPPPARDGTRGARTAGARTHQLHLQHRFFNDGADIEAVALPHTRIGDAPAALFVLLDGRKALIGLERIAAGGDELDDIVEIVTCEI